MGFLQVEVEEGTPRWGHWEQKPRGKLAGSKKLMGVVAEVAGQAVQGVQTGPEVTLYGGLPAVQERLASSSSLTYPHASIWLHTPLVWPSQPSWASQLPWPQASSFTERRLSRRAQGKHPGFLAGIAQTQS